MALLYAGSNLTGIFLISLIYFIISTIISIFSPFGIGFIIFSIIRGRTENETLRKVSFVFQIILSIITFLIGLLVSVLLFMSSYYGSLRLEQVLPAVAIFLGVVFVVILELGVIIWESTWLRRKFNE